METQSDIHVKKSLQEKDHVNEYTIHMKRRRKFPWWIFLLLLPLLLLIKCKKDITVVCMDSDSGERAAGVTVDLAYTAHFLWNEGKFFDDKAIELTQETDSTGTTTFKDLPFSVYSFIFYFFSDVTLNAKSECLAAMDVKRQFHTVRNVEMLLEPRYEDLHLRLVDKEKGFPLPGGTVVFQRKDGGVERTDTVTADSNGVVLIPHIRYCSDIALTQGSHFGYEDSLWTDTPARDLIDNDSTQMPLQPLYVDMDFHTIDDCRILLPGCALQVNGSISGTLPPNNSENGDFTVRMRMAELLSITASKKGFTTNDYSVRNASYPELQDPDRRVIPLQVVPDQCGQTVFSKETSRYLVRSYDVSKHNGEVNIYYDFYAAPDIMVIYDGTCRTEDKIIYNKNRKEEIFSGMITIYPTQSIITIIMQNANTELNRLYGASDWEYRVECPQMAEPSI